MSETAGVILAGGRSSRMGRKKELLPWRGRTLVEHLADSVIAAGMPCLIVSNEPQLLPRSLVCRPDVTVVPDRMESAGPISGIATAFRVRSEDVLLMLACDLPFVDGEQLLSLRAYGESMTDWDAVIVEAEQRLHPLFALYHRRTREAWETALLRRDHRVMAVVERLRIRTTPPGLLDPWAVWNVNTPNAYEQALQEQQKREQRRT